MPHQMNRLLVRLHRALRLELGMNAQMSMLIKEPIYRDEVLSRAELMGTDEVRRLAGRIRKLSQYSVRLPPHRA